MLRIVFTKGLFLKYIAPSIKRDWMMKYVYVVNNVPFENGLKIECPEPIINRFKLSETIEIRKKNIINPIGKITVKNNARLKNFSSMEAGKVNHAGPFTSS
jgi:hypothetical protein